MIRTALILFLVLLPFGGAEGRTWLVEKDGTGDFTIIQDALDAASDGDTILIGPGRFDEYRLYHYPGGDWNCFMNIDNSDLTIIGSGVQETIVGPDVEMWGEEYLNGGLMQVYHYSGVLTVEGIQFENTWTGVYIAANFGISFRNLQTEHTKYGMFIFGHGSISDCNLNDFANIGLDVHAPAENLVVENCDITGRRGLSLQNIDNIVLNNCRLDCYTGGTVEWCTGGIYNSVIEAEISGLSHFGSFEFTIRGNSLTGGIQSLYLGDSPENVIVEDNLINGGDYYALLLESYSPRIKNNDILRGNGYAVSLDVYNQAESINVDLTDNYWGTTDPEEIAAGIFDGHDDSDINAFVLFDPFAPGSVPTERLTFDGLKALFR